MSPIPSHPPSAWPALGGEHVRLPPAGKSPFRAKGLLYQGAQQFYRSRLGDLEPLATALEPELRAFFLEQPIVAGGWYDLLPIVPISLAAAHACGLPHHQLVRQNAAWIAERDINGAYRVLLKLTSAQAVAKRLPRLSMQYFDFGEADGEMQDDRVFVSLRRGIPEPLARWMSWVVEGFTPVALEAAGARAVRVRSDPPTSEGMVAGIPTVSMRFTIEWD